MNTISTRKYWGSKCLARVRKSGFRIETPARVLSFKLKVRAGSTDPEPSCSYTATGSDCSGDFPWCTEPFSSKDLFSHSHRYFVFHCQFLCASLCAHLFPHFPVGCITWILITISSPPSPSSSRWTLSHVWLTGLLSLSNLLGSRSGMSNSLCSAIATLWIYTQQ